MTTPPAGEHHTGTLNLTGQGNPYEAQDRAAAAIVRALADRGITMAPDGRHIHHVALACVDAAYPAIRQHIAEQIAAAIEDERDPDGFDTVVNRNLFVQHLAAKAREIGGGQ